MISGLPAVPDDIIDAVIKQEPWLHEDGFWPLVTSLNLESPTKQEAEEVLPVGHATLSDVAVDPLLSSPVHSSAPKTEADAAADVDDAVLLPQDFLVVEQGPDSPDEHQQEEVRLPSINFHHHHLFLGSCSTLMLMCVPVSKDAVNFRYRSSFSRSVNQLCCQSMKTSPSYFQTTR